jgi:hypothetical protein
MFGMFKGDSNGMGDVNASDYLAVKPRIGNTEYHKSDVNMTGDINASDYLSIKPNIGRMSNVPEP